ncbi:hypothetical protein [Corynebacterium macginleyi]|uniref:hypothetical protein n=2 Tax=Corynebacterium macginleyi TaxID=38290 RepID=UPI000EFA00D5|nr:hypothetical protein [Corynebacterium macginleyi]RMB65274.1 hypothetical protein D9542_10365 [Corynebacterium macginleyi]
MAHRTIATACNDLARALLTVERELATDRRTSPEDQLKVPISTFLTAVGNARSSQVNVVTEHRQFSGDNVKGVRLDMAVKNGRRQLTGHLELKSPNKSANPYRQSGWSKHDKKQWKRLENHSNLIYTNGWEWTLLRHGAGQPLAHIQLTPQPPNPPTPQPRGRTARKPGGGTIQPAGSIPFLESHLTLQP